MQGNDAQQLILFLVVVFSSILAIGAVPMLTAYASSKHALNGESSWEHGSSHSCSIGTLHVVHACLCVRVSDRNGKMVPRPLNNSYVV